MPEEHAAVMSWWLVLMLLLDGAEERWCDKEPGAGVEVVVAASMAIEEVEWCRTGVETFMMASLIGGDCIRNKKISFNLFTDKICNPTHYSSTRNL